LIIQIQQTEIDTTTGLIAFAVLLLLIVPLILFTSKRISTGRVIYSVLGYLLSIPMLSWAIVVVNDFLNESPEYTDSTIYILATYITGIVLCNYLMIKQDYSQFIRKAGKN
jgi:cytosine/uracil/thiamine/allantoin permease